MKQLEVQIMGQNYVLGCPENSEARLTEAVRTVDSAMCKIRDAGKVKARDRIAVLAALNLAYQLAAPAALPPESPPADPPQPLPGDAAEAPAQALANDSADPSRDSGIGSAKTAAQLARLLEQLDAALAVPNAPD